ncbi:MAG TPA: DUF4166 domain-containing protein [Gammaproteobacteria bacterium]
MATTLPVIAQALGEQWHALHPLVRRHYSIAPGSYSRVVMAGEMSEVHFSRRAAPLIYMARLFGALVAERASAIPVTVVNTTRHDDPAMHWHRTFRYPDGTQRIFESRMVYAGGNEIIEYVRLGLGIRMAISVQEGALIFESRGFQWGRDSGGLRIPDLLLLGRSRIVERAISEEQFEVEFDTHHPLYGRSFGYNGLFRIVECR